ncbi:MAG: flagellar motor protein MotB [Bdellovibrionales bacterium]
MAVRMLRSQMFRSRREHQSPEGDHNSNWAISYGDMVTLLLAFFVLFFSLGNDTLQIRLIDKLVKKEFAYVAPTRPDATWGPIEQTADPVAPDLKTTVQGNKLLVEFPIVSFFKTAEYVLTPEGENSLKKFASVFTGFTGQMRLIVRGYTDSRPVRRGRHQPFSDNLELSALRAIAALRALNSAGIPHHLMRIGGYGETDKSQQVSAEERLRYDRKIVLVIEPLDSTERGLENLPWSRTPTGGDK